MTILNLGVADIPYSHVPKPGKGRGRKQRRAVSGSQTTGDVAGYLEDKYHVMQNFFELRRSEIDDALVKSLRGALFNLSSGAPVSVDPFAAGMGDIETAFRKFIEDRVMEGIGYPGVPTGAALKGVNHRLLHPYAKGNPRRPSFRDTGLYEQSFKSWIDP